MKWGYRRAAEILRTEGVGGLGRRLWRKVYTTTDIGYIELDLPGVAARYTRRSAITVELVELAQDRQLWGEQDLFGEAVKNDRNGFPTFVALEGSQVIGLVSFATTDFFEELLGQQFPVRPGTVFSRCLRIHTALRGTRLPGILCEAAILYYRDHGYRKMHALVELWNRGSVHALRHLGFREVKRFRRARVFGHLLAARVVPMRKDSGFPKGV
jgi:L-amino acid N-acyltransferase YncA